ncbi:hypothetical protein [Rhizobium rhizoryzae]|jgi:hypothetical protein|uniref:DUF3426 domain-containing protein n=1 Tax=Rhizobium rhizoryzae TaxID=451876 RepID=A0A7W6LK74_9HYPH|nr:hypothetical protein [Rhizobium rhizoryzae]MBB4144581.1 hypothetical protein [Rhizobium rhizoryzae]
MDAFRSRRTKSENSYDILPPDSMGSKSVRRALSRGIVEDAEFVTVRDSAKQPSREQETRRTPSGFHNDNATRAETARQKPARRPHVVAENQPALSPKASLIERIEQKLMQMSADFFSAVVAFIFVMVFGFSGGFSLISTDTPKAAQGLDITNVSLANHDSGGMQILQIYGIIENRGTVSRKVQPMRADLMVGDKVVFTTVIQPPAPEIGQHQSRGFTARIPHPGGKNPQLKLSFIEPGATAS